MSTCALFIEIHCVLRPKEASTNPVGKIPGRLCCCLVRASRWTPCSSGPPTRTRQWVACPPAAPWGQPKRAIPDSEERERGPGPPGTDPPGRCSGWGRFPCTSPSLQPGSGTQVGHVVPPPPTHTLVNCLSPNAPRITQLVPFASCQDPD